MQQQRGLAATPKPVGPARYAYTSFDDRQLSDELGRKRSTKFDYCKSIMLLATAVSIHSRM